ncbi:hypothetical protein AB6A40_006234 [Gnathostoma spinigerum]|uniref:Protein YIPF n=1 Tax=Gnathostoma spinigerum TaxID=75299 RepID=A0ABD6EIY3_9BILA
MSSYQQHRPTDTAIDIGEVVTNRSSVNDIEFYSSAQNDSGQGTLSGYDDLSGNIKTASVSKSDEIHHRRLSRGGPAAKFLEDRGFGWLLEVEDDEEVQKPLLEELDIDIKDIYYKVRCVLFPLPYFRMKLSIVRESPDFWGPLFVVMAYGLLSLYGQLSVVSWILTIWFVGSFFIFFLARALGGEVGYSQILGIVGYCLIPLVVIGAIIPVVSRLPLLTKVIGCFGVLWSVYSAGTLLCVDELLEKRSLLLYPVFLLYIYFFSLYSGV